MIHTVSQSGHVSYGIKKLVIDKLTDFQDMEIGMKPGSECYCIENGKTYILSTNEGWKIKKSLGGDEYEFFTAEEVLALLEGGNS